jgi:hypothetical protein
MSDRANDEGRHRDDFTWRFRQSEDDIAAGLGGRVVVELIDANGSALASVSLPPETMDQLLRPHLSIFAELQLDGSVSLDTEFFAISPSSTTTDLLELVRQALASEMLEDEPEAAQMLSKFRDRLIKSLELVDQVIASLPKD